MIYIITVYTFKGEKTNTAKDLKNSESYEVAAKNKREAFRKLPKQVRQTALRCGWIAENKFLQMANR